MEEGHHLVLYGRWPTFGHLWKKTTIWSFMEEGLHLVIYGWRPPFVLLWKKIKWWPSSINYLVFDRKKPPLEDHHLVFYGGRPPSGLLWRRTTIRRMTTIWYSLWWMTTIWYSLCRMTTICYSLWRMTTIWYSLAKYHYLVFYGGRPSSDLLSLGLQKSKTTWSSKDEDHLIF